MHKLIYALVEASDTDEALRTGKAVFNYLVGGKRLGTGEFDYFVTFDDTESTVGGPTRYGDLPVAAPVNSLSGQELLERGWRATKDDFDRHLETIIETVTEYTDEAMMADANGIRTACEALAERQGSTISLYDADGRGIRHRGELDRVLRNTDSLWIVPADAHY